MKNLLDLTLELNQEKPKCKGLVYRYIETNYKDSTSKIIFKQEFAPLKKKSCKGCEECGYLLDALTESDFDVIIPPELTNRDLVKLVVTNISHDWETGYVDDYDLKFEKVTE